MKCFAIRSRYLHKAGACQVRRRKGPTPWLAECVFQRMNGVSSTFGPPTVSNVIDFVDPSPARTNVTMYCEVRLAATFFAG